VPWAYQDLGNASRELLPEEPENRSNPSVEGGFRPLPIVEDGSAVYAELATWEMGKPGL
jgi:hypothetical protein